MVSINKNDIIYLALAVLFSYFLLTQTSGIPIESYERLADLKTKGISAPIDPTFIAPFLGILSTAIIYLALRFIFKFSKLSSVVSTLIAVSSGAFASNFSAGMISTPVQFLFGVVDIQFAFELVKLLDVLLLLPLSLFGMYLLIKEREQKRLIYAAIGLVFIVVAFVYPLKSVFVLAVFGAFGLDRLKDSTKRDQMVLGALIGIAVLLTILEVTAQTIGLSVLVGALIAAIVYSLNFRKKAVVALTVVLLFSALISSTAIVLSSETLDDETLAAIIQLKGISGEIVAASIYGDKISAVTFYAANRKVDTTTGMKFLFENKTPEFDYLLLDMLVLDAPRNMSRTVNLSVRFDTFIPAGLGRENTQIYSYYLSEANILRIPADESGRIISDRVFVGSENISIFRLLQVNATDPTYSRYIYPRRETDLNVFKLLFPEQFGSFGEDDEKTALLVWESNSSRMKLFRIE